MSVHNVIAQLRTTDLEASLAFYTSTLGFELDFRFADFYAGVRFGEQQFVHLKRVDDGDPSVRYVQDGGHQHLFFSVDDVQSYYDRFSAAGVTIRQELMEHPWEARDFVVQDDQGHVLCFSQGLREE